MNKFDEKSFHELFSNAFIFSECFPNPTDDKIDEAVEHAMDNKLKNLTQLSIFPLLKNITSWGENVGVEHYRTIKKDDEIVGAKGILYSSMDWSDPENPEYYYEFGHIPADIESIEYVRELHFDDVVLKVFNNLNKVSEVKEHHPREEMIKRIIDNSQDFSGLKYKLLVSTGNLELWKVGFHQGPYQILRTTDSSIGEFPIDNSLKLYINDRQYVTIGELKKEDPKILLEKRILEESVWYNIGSIDLDPELTKDKLVENKRAKAEEYETLLTHGKIKLKLSEFDSHVDSLHGIQIAGMIAYLHKKGDDEVFRNYLKQKYPQKLKEAREYIKEMLDFYSG